MAQKVKYIKLRLLWLVAAGIALAAASNWLTNGGTDLPPWF